MQQMIHLLVFESPLFDLMVIVVVIDYHTLLIHIVFFTIEVFQI